LDFDKTLQCYQGTGQAKLWEQEPDPHRHNKEKEWLKKVKSARTNDFYQAEDLIRRELVPADWKPPHKDAKGKPLRYPIKHVNEIIRKRLSDGTEWLLSRQMWIGLDQAGNELHISMIDKEKFNDVLPIYKLVALEVR
jgi:hypothetical protein